MFIVVAVLLWVFVLKGLALEVGEKSYGWIRPDPMINKLPESQRL